MRKGSGWTRRIAAGAVALLLTGCCVVGQQVEEGKRKAKTKVNPVYPELARKMNIVGRVKVEVVILPDGHVKSVRALGGSPVLIQPCLDAVKEWRFEPASEDTVELLEFHFGQQ